MWRSSGGLCLAALFAATALAWMSPDGSATVTGLNSSRLPEIGDESSFERVSISPQHYLCAAISSLLVVLPILAFAKLGKAKVPSTYSTQLFKYILLLLSFCVSFLALYAGALGIWFSLTKGHSTIHFLFSLSLTLPMLSIGFFLFMWRAVPFGNRIPSKNEALATIEERGAKLVCELSIEMGIDHQIPIVVSPRTNFSPHITGISAKTAQLTLPQNFWELTKKAANDDDVLAGALARLVLAHELAHVRNGDVLILPLIRLLRGPWLFVVLLSAAFYLINACFVGNVKVAVLGKPILFLLLLSLPFFLICIEKMLRDRERLADALGSLFVSPPLLHRLSKDIGSDGSELSPIERFHLLTVSMQNGLGPHLGFAFRTIGEHLGRIIGWVRQRGTTAVSRFLARARARGVAIARKQHLVADTALPTYNDCVFIGILVYFIFVSMVVLKDYVIVTRLHLLDKEGAMPDSIGPVSDVVEEVLRAYRTQSLWSMLQIMAGQACGLVGATLLLLRLRDAPPGVMHASPLFVIQIALRLVTILAVFHLLNCWSPELFPLSAHPAVMLTPTLVALTITIYIAILLFSLELRQNLQRARVFLFLLSSGILLGLVLTSLAAAVLFSGLQFPARIMLFMACVVGWLVIWHSHILGQRALNMVANPPENHLTLTVFGKDHFAELPSTIAKAMDVRLIRKAFLVPLVNTFLPSLFITGYFYHVVFETDRKAQSMLQSSSVEPSGRIAPVTLVVFYILLWSVILFVCVAGAKALFARHSNMHRRYELLALGRLERLLDRVFLRRAQKKELIQDMVRDLKEKHACFGISRPYIRSNAGVPLFACTCETASVLMELGTAAELTSEMLGWIRRCESPTGGFGPAPGAGALARQTVAGLRCLVPGGWYSRENLGTHRHWLDQRIGVMPQIVRELTPSAWLQMLHDLCEARSLVSDDGDWTEQTSQPLRTIAMKQWNRGPKTALDTLALVSLLVGRGNSDALILNEVRQKWLPLYEREMLRLVDRRQLDDLWITLKILQLLFPNDYLERDSVQQVADTLFRVYEKKGV